MKVMKFGGSSVANGERIRDVTDIVAGAAREGRIAVVLSAMKGVTDLLIEAARRAEAGTDAHKAVVEKIRDRHDAAVDLLFPAAERASVTAPLSAMLADLEEILRGTQLLRECSPRTLDLVMSFGERLSCSLSAAYMRTLGLGAEVVDAREMILTDERFGSASVDFPATYAKIKTRLSSVRGIPVIPGFIGATPKGVTTTLGRNGSDYTASIIGGGLEAELIDIWTDVDGVLSADPRLVPDAFVVPFISFEEAMELSFFGAKVLHPYSMIPAVEKGIPIRIKNTYNPSAPGTIIGPAAMGRGGREAGVKNGSAHPITGIASIEGISTLNIEGGGMIGIPGIAARIFSALAREGINIIMISQASSEHTICLVFKTQEADRALGALRRELALELETRRIEGFELVKDLLVVSVIGENMHGTPGIAGRLFSSLGEAGVNILVIAQGSSERNISFVIEEKNHSLALRTIHSAFLRSK
jgi:aspartokinase/homoserine dehydrogenase 1